MEEVTCRPNNFVLRFLKNFSLASKIILGVFIVFSLTIILVPDKAQADCVSIGTSVRGCLPDGTGCYGVPAGSQCSGYSGRPNYYVSYRLDGRYPDYCTTDRPSLYQMELHCCSVDDAPDNCSGSGGSGGPKYRASHVWVRVLSKGPSGKPIAWKGPQGNDTTWDTRWNNDWTKNKWSVDPVNADGSFNRYQAVQTGPIKTWDTTRNKVGANMNFVTSNLTQPVVWFTEPAEYWANHFCIGSQPYAFNPSDNKALQKVTKSGVERYCEMNDDELCRHQEVDGCWTREPIDHYVPLKQLLDKANVNPDLGSMAWADLRYDEYYTLYFSAISKIDTEFNLFPPDGYSCKDVRWFKNHEDRASEEDHADEFGFTVNADGSCRVDDFQVSDRGNLFIFEIEQKAPPAFSVSGRVVNAQTGAGLPNISVRVEKVSPTTKAVVGSTLVTTDSQGYYTSANFITVADWYNVKVESATPSGYMGSGYAVKASDFSPKQTFHYIKRSVESVGYSWNYIKNPIAGNGSPWADTYVGELGYTGQKPNGSDCSGPDANGLRNRCWLAFDPPYSIKGRVVDYRTGNALSTTTPITIRVDRYASNGGPGGPSIDYRTTTTDSNGYYNISNFVKFSDRYSVEVTNLSATGYVGTAYAVDADYAWGPASMWKGPNIGYAWRHDGDTTLSGGRDITVGEASYTSQRPGGYDCVGWDPNATKVPTDRCWFTFDPTPTPPQAHVTGVVKLNYSYPTLLNPRQVRYNESGYAYNVQILKGSNGALNQGTWQNVNWVDGVATRCSAVWPDRIESNLPACNSYFKSPSTYLNGEYFSARIQLPDNKYSCIWTVTGSGANGNESIMRGIGTVEDTAGGTYCTVRSDSGGSYRMEDIYGIVPGGTGSTHIEFTLFHDSNRIRGRIWDATGNVINPIVSGFQIKKIRNDGTSTGFFAPFGDAFLSPIYSWPNFPFSDSTFTNYFRRGEKIGFSLPNPNNAFRCGWILDSRPGSNDLKSSFSEFGAGFNPEILSTYPEEWLYLKRGISENCIEQSGRAVLQMGPGTPLYENNLYVFKLEKKARVSVELKMTYPYLNGTQSNTVRTIAESEIREPFTVETGLFYIFGTGEYTNWTPAAVYNENSACSAKYPNNLEGTSGVFGMSGATCNAYYVSNLEYKQGSDYLAAVRFKYRPGKYDCTWNVTTTANGTLNGWKSWSVDGQWEYCTTSPFPIIADDTGTKNITTNNWPTHVSMSASFNKLSITSTVFNNNGAVTTAYTPQASLTSNGGPYTPSQIMTSSAGHNYYLLPYNNGLGWVPDTTVYVSVNATNKSCYGLSRETTGPYGFSTNIDAVATIGDWGSLGAGFNPALNAPAYSSDCSGLPITLKAGDFNPALHNQFYTFVVPKLQIGPSSISVVNGSDLCDQLGDPITAQMEVSLHNLSQPSEPINSIITTNGYFDYLGLGLKYTDQYSLGYTVLDGSVNLSSYGICPSPDSPAQSNPMTINFQNTTQFPQLTGYPNISDAAAVVDGSIKFYKKDSNKWWQVYNGGVYTGSSSLPINSTSTGEGMPVDAVLVGDASGPLFAFNLPNYHGHQLGYVGALISANEMNPNTFNRYGLSGKDWGINSHTNKMGRLDLNRVYDAASDPTTGWKKMTDLGEAVKDSASAAVLIEADNLDVNTATEYTRAGNKIILIANPDGGDANVTINQPITKPVNVVATAVAIVLVRGNVTIMPTVNDLRLVIYATGTITVSSAGRDLDLPLYNGGALYSDRDVIIERDLPDTPVWEKFPAVKNAYTPEIFNRMEELGSIGFPSVITESKVYWVIEE
jgi:hypothetical protein